MPCARDGKRSGRPLAGAGSYGLTTQACFRMLVSDRIKGSAWTWPPRWLIWVESAQRELFRYWPKQDGRAPILLGICLSAPPTSPVVLKGFEVRWAAFVLTACSRPRLDSV